jgi:hypothetical protein
MSRRALARGWHVENRGLAPNVIYFGCFEDFNAFFTSFTPAALARDLLAHFGFSWTAKKEHGWHGRTTAFNQEL